MTPAPVLGSAVVRILDVEATFRQRSALPGDTVNLAVQTDAPWLRMTLLRCGTEPEPTNSNYEMRGVQVGEPQRIDLSRYRGRRTTVPVTLEVDASGVYAVRLEGPSGHKGYAPLIVRPPAPTVRAAVVIPTTTWHAYNYYDHNGDGFGDTWYSLWAQKRIDLTRPHLRAGVPERWRSYDLQFLHWLTSRGHQADVYADEDIDLFPDAATLRAAYDLIVFPGHTEYVTKQLYDLIQGYRDLGGRLIFLSANNFFRRVDRAGDHAKLIGEWRNLGRPESAVLGVQYLANDDGRRQEPFTVIGSDVAPWAFAGTGLRNGSAFGRYGIESRRAHLELPTRGAGARDDSRPARPRPHRGDDVLRDRAGRTRLLGRRPQLRRHDHALARDRPTARQRLGPHVGRPLSCEAGSALLPRREVAAADEQEGQHRADGGGHGGDHEQLVEP